MGSMEYDEASCSFFWEYGVEVIWGRLIFNWFAQPWTGYVCNRVKVATFSRDELVVLRIIVELTLLGFMHINPEPFLIQSRSRLFLETDTFG